MSSIPESRKMPWRKAWQPTAVFLPEKSHEQRSLTDYSPWSRKESDMTEATEQRVCVCVCVCFTSVIKGSPIFQPAKICFFIASDPTSSLNLPSLGWILFSAETEILIKVGILSDRDLNNLQLKFWIQFSNDMRSPEVGSQGCVMP